MSARQGDPVAGEVEERVPLTRPHLAALAGILLLFAGLSLAFNALTPPWEGYDELHHFKYVDYLRDNHKIPVMPTPLWEGYEPPAYYVVQLAVITVLNLPPPAAIASPRPDGPPLAHFGHPANECLLCDGELTVRVMRLVSTLCGLATVWLAFLIARVIFPRRPGLALAAAAATALVPQFIFMDTLINNDSMSFLASALLLLALAGIVMRPPWRSKLRYAALAGVAVAFGLWTKAYVLPLLPLVGLAILLARLNVRHMVTLAALAGGLALVLTAPYLYHNVHHYGSIWPLREEYLNDVLTYPPQIVHFHVTDRIMYTAMPIEMFQSFWYRGGWGQLRAPEWMYTLFAVLSPGLALAGAAALLWRRRLGLASPQVRMLALFVVGFLVLYGSVFYHNLTVAQWRGRYMFPLLPGLMLFLVLGAMFIAPARWRSAAAWALPALLLLCNIVILTRVAAAYTT